MKLCTRMPQGFDVQILEVFLQTTFNVLWFNSSALESFLGMNITQIARTSLFSFSSASVIISCPKVKGPGVGEGGGESEVLPYI